mgnify:CR=1 FL=1
MGNQYENIANIQIEFTNNCSEEHKEIIKQYWEFRGSIFINKPGKLKDKCDLTQTELSKLVVENSTTSFYLYCESCNSYERQYVTSQTGFRQALSNYNGRYFQSFKCDYCETKQKEQAKIERNRKHNELVENLNLAIKNKNWKNLSNFDKAFLIHCLEMNFLQLKKYYGNLLGQSQYIKFIKALERIEHQNLLVLERDSLNNYIVGYKYLMNLNEYKDEINFKEEQSESTATMYSDSKTLKFKLTINEFQHHQDSPLYAGTLNFKEKIVIDPDVNYVFGMWQGANESLYLTLTPQEDMDKLPEQKRIPSSPIPIQQGITDFLKNMGENIKFE